MSLVIAFVGAKGAAMAGDMREIAFQGDKISKEKLENELYSGAIATNDELDKRAEELGVKIWVQDNKSKITQRHGVLVGEVASIEGGVVRKRRVYASAGNYLLAEIVGSKTKVTDRGSSAFVVLGNKITQEIAYKCIREHWKDGSFQDAIKVLILVMEAAAVRTPSVSKKYILVHTLSKNNPLEALELDQKHLVT